MYPNNGMPYPGGHQGNLPPTGLQPQMGFGAPQPQPGYPNNPYPPQGYGQQSSYPPNPGFPQGYAPYGGAPSSAPYPGAPSSAPYPGAPAGCGYAGTPSSASYPGAPTGLGYPGAQVPYQGGQMSSPYTGVPASASNPMIDQGVQLVPTIREVPGFDPAQDAKVLRTAMKGMGTDEKALISVLCKRTNAQRLQIAKMFKASFGKDLVADLKSETSGKFEDLLVALMVPRYDFLAQRVNYAVKGLGTNEDALIDVLCTSSNADLQQIQEAYQRLYGRSLEADVVSDTGGHFKRILVSLCAGSRSTELHVDSALVQQDAQDLKTAGIDKFGTDESVFNMILVTRSFPHLRAVFEVYEKLTAQTMERTIKGEFSGDIKNALLTIVKCIQNRPRYFAERLMASMKGMGTNDSALIFYIVSRCDVDLGTIKEEYMKLYSKPLAKDIKGDTSGDYRRALLALCGDE